GSRVYVVVDLGGEHDGVDAIHGVDGVHQPLDGDVTDVRVEVDDEERRRPGLDRAVERRVHHRAAINVEAVADPHRREDAGDGRRSHDHLATELLADVVVFKYLQLARLPVRRYDPQFPRRV